MCTGKENEQPRERYEMPFVSVILLRIDNAILTGSDPFGGIEDTEDENWIL